MSEITDQVDRLQYEELNAELVVPSDWLIQVAEAFGGELPTDYAEFLTCRPRTGSCHGEALIEGLAPAPAWPEGRLSWLCLFGFSEGTPPDLIYMNENLDHKIDGYAIIGDDSFGNFFYMKMDGSDKGAIYIFDRDGGSAPSSNSLDLYLISSSFREFLAKTMTRE
jgi:hypothetical protein